MKLKIDTRDFMVLWMESRSEGSGASADALIVRGKSESPLRPLSGSTEPAAASSFSIGPRVVCVRENVGFTVVENAIRIWVEDVLLQS